MNKRMIAYILGILLLCDAGLMLLPTIVSLIYGEAVLTSFLATIVLLVLTGLILVAMKPKEKTIAKISPKIRKSRERKVESFFIWYTYIIP